jgi:hypothetical protein
MRVLGLARLPSFVDGETLTIAEVSFTNEGSSPYDKMKQLRRMVDEGANDPRVCELAAAICAPCAARDSYAEAAAILSWVQSNVKYMDEDPEIFRSANYTATHGYGDCDDGVILAGALCKSIGIGTVVTVLSKRAGLFTWEPFHVYLCAALPKRNPTELVPMETTMKVPLGWDPHQYAVDHASEM